MSAAGDANDGVANDQGGWTAEAVAGVLHSARFGRPFRKYQALALDALDRRDASSARFHVVAPPGSGKTVLGLEIVRRIGSPALVLCPNTAIREQWRRQVEEFRPPGGVLPDGFVSVDAERVAPLTVLTYQALCNLSDPGALLDEAALAVWRGEQREALHLTDAELAELEARRRAEQPRELARELAQIATRLKVDLASGNGASQVRLFELLHPNSRRLVGELGALGCRVVVLDECHHLCSLWGYAVREVVRVLGESVLVVGLTSTPPADLSGDELELYQGLLGEPSFQVPTPAVVREGHLAPYQELAYFVAPLPIELDFVRARHVLFQELVARVIGPGFASVSLGEWIIQRVRLRESGPEVATGEGGAKLSFGRFSRQHPALARAAVRYLHAGGQPLPDEIKLTELLRQPPDLDDWVVLLEDYCLRCLRPSGAAGDAVALRQIRQALVGLGYVLTRNGIRAYASPIDRVLALSAAKEVAAADILRREQDVLGPRLRAVVMCDYEQSGAPVGEDLAAVLDPQAGSALHLLAYLTGDPNASLLNPILVTGSGVYCGEPAAAGFLAWLASQNANLAAGCTLEREARAPTGSGGQIVVRVEAAARWNTADYLPLVTAWFEAGGTQCLIGTRALLGEGWDAPRANVLVDLTTAATHTSMHQIRGRTLRIDQSWSEKVADNWDVVCVADEPKGGSDYGRFLRKHRTYYALAADGTIESGVGHVHAALSPFGPPAATQLAALNTDLLRRAGERSSARTAWRVGEPYENVEVPTVRVRSQRPLGIGPVEARVSVGATTPEKLGRRAAYQLLAGWGAAGAALLIGAPEIAAAGVALVVGAGVAAGFVTRLGASFQAIPADLALDGCARALLAALQEEGIVPTDVTEANLTISPRPDGYYRCSLTGVTPEASRAFAECLEELLAPVENQRYLIPRYWADVPSGTGRQALFVLRGLLRRGAYRVQYHPIPSYFAANRKRADVFAKHWRRFVSPGEPVYARREAGERLAAAERGADAFGLLCQVRSMWQ